MDNHSEAIGAIAVVAVLGGILYCVKHPIPSIGDKVVIPPTNVPALIRKDHGIDGTVAVTHVPSGDSIKADTYLGNLYWTPEDRDAGTWRVKMLRYRYLIDPGLDVGAYGGYCDGFETGIRLSPVRLLYGTTALDGLIGSKGAGAGVSVYPMPEYFGPLWRHLGVGYGREYAYDGDSSNNLFYMALSTRF